MATRTEAEQSTLVPLIPLPATAEARWTEAAHALTLSEHRSPNTQRAYQADLADFFAWRGQPASGPEAVRALCTLDQGGLALALNAYKAHLRERRLAEATVNRRLAAIRSLLRMARRLGAPVPDVAGLVTGEKITPYRDTRGPGLPAAAALLAAVDRNSRKGKRDYALLVLLCENALRRGEIVACNVGDFEPAQKRLCILGKGRGSQREPVTLSETGVAALEAHLATRGGPLSPESPLFVNVSRAHGDTRLTGQGLRHLVDGWGKAVLGCPLHPHALRHTAITAALDATGGDVRTVQRLSRHARLETLLRYDDNRSDLQGAVTTLLSALLKNTP